MPRRIQKTRSPVCVRALSSRAAPARLAFLRAWPPRHPHPRASQAGRASLGWAGFTGAWPGAGGAAGGGHPHMEKTSRERSGARTLSRRSLHSSAPPVLRRLGCLIHHPALRAGAPHAGQHQAGVRGRPRGGHVSGQRKSGDCFFSSPLAPPLAFVGCPNALSCRSPRSPPPAHHLSQRHLGPLLHRRSGRGDGRPETVPGRQGGGGESFGGGEREGGRGGTAETANRWERGGESGSRAR